MNMAAEVISLGEGALTRSRASEVVHQETQVETRDYEDHTFAGDRCCTPGPRKKLWLGPLSISSGEQNGRVRNGPISFARQPCG